MNISRGEVWRVDLDPRKGHEQGDIRPALVISVDEMNHHAGLSVVLPLSKTQKSLPFWLPVSPPEGGVTKSGNILCEQVRVVSHERFSERLGEVSTETLKDAEKIVKVLLGFT